MILELTIQNFLSFKDAVTFSFEATSDNTLQDYYIAGQPDGTRILKMAMVYGANASGKTNLVKAFELIRDFVHHIPEERNVDTPFVPFMFDKTQDEPGQFELLFYAEGKKHKYQLVIDEDTVFAEKLFYYPGTQPAVIFNRYFDEKHKVSQIEFGSKIKISPQAQESIQLKALKNTSVFAAYNQVNLSIPELDRVNDWFEEKYMRSINPYHSLTEFSNREIKNNPELKAHALKFLKEADFNITDIVFEESTQEVPESLLKKLDILPIPDEQKARIREEKKVHFEDTIFKHRVIRDGQEEFHPLEEARQSRGTQRFYGLSAPFYHAIANNSFLPIDEIGSALHPLLIIHFIKEFLKKSDQAQLLFTSYNLSILNEKDILRKDVIWFTEKTTDGSTILYTMADFPIRKELSFYNAYKLGKFGAVPNLS